MASREKPCGIGQVGIERSLEIVSYEVAFIEVSICLPLLVLEDIDQCSNVGGNLHRELIARFQSLSRVSTQAYSSWCTRYNHSSWWERRALREEADQLWYAEDKVTIERSDSCDIYYVYRLAIL